MRRRGRRWRCRAVVPGQSAAGARTSSAKDGAAAAGEVRHADHSLNAVSYTHLKLLARRTSDSTHTRFELRLAGEAVECILLAESRSVLDPLVGADVAVRGVPVTVRTVSGEIQRVQIYVAAPGDVESRGAAPLPGASGQSPSEPAHATPGLPVLTTAAQVKSRARRDDNRIYPVRLRAVVTLTEPDWSGITVQDATAGIYVEAVSYTHLDVYKRQLPGQVVHQ